MCIAYIERNVRFRSFSMEDFRKNREDKSYFGSVCVFSFFGRNR